MLHAEVLVARQSRNRCWLHVQIRARKAFMNWSAMMECTARRATEAPASAGARPWVRGWDATLSLIEANVKALGGVASQRQTRTHV